MPLSLSLSRCCGSRWLLSPVTGKGFWWDLFLLDVDVDERLHWLQLLVRDKLVVFGHGHEMDEAHVQNFMLVDVPEWIHPVGVVQMSIAAEHLFHDALAVLVECWWETTRLADPVLTDSNGSGVVCSRIVR